MRHYRSISRLHALAAVALAWSIHLVQAQEVQELNLNGVPPDMIRENAPPSPPMSGTGGVQAANVRAAQSQQVSTVAQTRMRAPGTPATDLGQSFAAAPAPAPAPAAPSTAAAAAGRAAQPAPAVHSPRLRSAARPAGGDIERAVFDRAPVRVPLALNRERLITLPAPAALHVPNDMERVARIEILDRTLYVTALTPFTPIRVVAELIDSGQQIPLDLVADSTTASTTAELEVSVIDSRGGAASAAAASAAPAADPAAPPMQSADMVELTRHAARQLYAPRRLAWTTPGVVQVGVPPTPVPGLIRGLNAETVPMGQWKSGPLYVTAVRVTNRSPRAVEIPLEQVRGRWLAATAQHGRVGPSGSESDTTAIYLVCDRSFEACL